MVKSIQLQMDGSKVGRAHGYFEAIRVKWVGLFMDGLGLGCVGYRGVYTGAPLYVL